MKYDADACDAHRRREREPVNLARLYLHRLSTEKWQTTLQPALKRPEVELAMAVQIRRDWMVCSKEQRWPPRQRQSRRSLVPSSRKEVCSAQQRP